MQMNPCVLWFTGLSGSGKSTISEELFKRLRENGLKVEYLDGDAIREVIPGTGFTREERMRYLQWIGFVAGTLERHGIIVVASFVSPYRESRDFIRKLSKQFVEIYVSTPLEECEKRDVKGLYARARRDEIKNFTGISDPYEEPLNPELNLDTTKLSVEQSIKLILRYCEGANGPSRSSRA